MCNFVNIWSDNLVRDKINSRRFFRLEFIWLDWAKNSLRTILVWPGFGRLPLPWVHLLCKPKEINLSIWCGVDRFIDE